MTNPDIDYWLCVQTKPNREKYAKLQLERQGFLVYLPFVRFEKAIRKKIQWVTRPMFSRYLFVKYKPKLVYTSIESTIGVSKLVKFNQVPAKVANDVINDIMNRCDESSTMIIEDREIEPGEAVNVLDGPYQGLHAIFHRYTNDQERIVILMEMMQNVVEVEIDRNIIEKG